MAWYSLLPDYMSGWETWIIRIFMILSILTIGPWAALVAFDIVYYVFRIFVYQVPFFGGRAQGQRKPRAPTLTERPSGRRRGLTLQGETAIDEARKRSSMRKKFTTKLVQNTNEE